MAFFIVQTKLSHINKLKNRKESKEGFFSLQIYKFNIQTYSSVKI